ncbi:MAG: hypothetical protein Q9195_007797 [Heterodermia aff. obscurata]
MKNARSSIEHVLHAHTRAITDINFSAHHPDVLATCAVDSFVHCWDIRHPARPAITFCDWFAGATQVKWNRQESHIIASSHDKMLRIWDDRKGAYPLRSIEAHATKIYGIDWNRAEPHSLVTCSLDKTIKFWDYDSATNKPQKVIHTPFPVWRARHTPFGYGLLAMPQRGDCDLHLYDRRPPHDAQEGDAISPVCSFEGHDDRVKEFLWRPRGATTDGIDSREFQLVSWGSDKMLRLHQVNDGILATVGYQRGRKVKSKINVTRINAAYKTFREVVARSPIEDPDVFERFSLLQSGFNSSYDKGSRHGMSKELKIERGLRDAGPARSMAVARNKDLVDMDPIAWMKGVKIGKRGTSPSGMRRNVSSIFSPKMMGDRLWETFESLGEEITYVGQKFAKVVFDEIDMLNRVVTLSLMGPWSSTGTSTWIKCRLQFPDSYPETAAPLFAIKESPNTTDEQLKNIDHEIQSITKAYVARQFSSLEAIIHYLLGERDLNRSLLWLAARPDGELDVPHNSAESSSDEDDQLQSSQIDMNENLIASNAEYNVPLPKACGAFWADDGRLVCFFPPRQEKLDPLIGKLNLKTTSQKGVFEGFGRLDQVPVVTKRPSTFDTSDSGNSEFEFLSSSSNSSTSSYGANLSGQLFKSSMTWPLGALDNLHDQSVDESYRSTGAGENPLGSSANYVSIHACHDLLPSKQKLAKEYIISKDHQESCSHNSRVAAEFGAQDTADIWSLVKLIIRKQIPFEVVQDYDKDESIVAAARRAVHPLQTRDSAIDLSYDLAEDLPAAETVQWGGHPFGSRWLVDSLEPLGASTTSSCRPQDQWPSSIDSEYSENDAFYPSAQVAHGLYSVDSSDLQTAIRPNGSTARSSTSPSAASPLKESFTPAPRSIFPSIDFKQSRTTLERQDSQSTSLSVSPEQLRHVPRSNSNLASAFAASLSRPFSFSTSTSSSPPTQPRKRLSPAGSYLGAHPGVSWSTASIFSKTSTIAEDPGPAHSLSVSDVEEDIRPVHAPPVFKTKLKNQHQFPDDDSASIPLLNAENEWQYRAYRDAYAHMLFVWGLPIAMCEVLKYNGEPTKTTTKSEPSDLAIGKPTSHHHLAATQHQQQGLHITQTCPTCNSALPNGHTCPRCSTSPRPRPLICLFCTSLIRGLASPCFSCGHVLHSSCRALLQTLFSTENEEEQEQGTCISGCGCHCSAPQAIVIDASSSPEPIDTHADPAQEEEEQPWQDVVYESLARNLGGALTPKSSQIWRGGEDGAVRKRQKSVGSGLRNEEAVG